MFTSIVVRWMHHGQIESQDEQEPRVLVGRQRGQTAEAANKVDRRRCSWAVQRRHQQAGVGGEIVDMEAELPSGSPACCADRAAATARSRVYLETPTCRAASLDLR